MTEATPASRPAIVPVGEALQAARLGRSLSLEDVAGRTRVPLRHLDAIERANMAELPAVPYAVGFVKSYARVVGLDPDALASQFRGEIAGIGDGRRVVPSFEPADPARVPPRWVAVVALALVIAIAAAYLLMRNGAFGGDRAEDRARLAAGTGESGAPAAPAAPAAAAPTPAVSAPAPDGAVAITAAEPVWVKIYDGAQTLFIGSMAAGQRFDVPAGAAAPMIWTGRPESIRVTVGSTAIPPLGPPSRRIKDVSLKAPALLARTAGNAAAAGNGAIPAAAPSGFDAPGNAG